MFWTIVFSSRSDVSYPVYNNDFLATWAPRLISATTIDIIKLWSTSAAFVFTPSSSVNSYCVTIANCSDCIWLPDSSSSTHLSRPIRDDSPRLCNAWIRVLLICTIPHSWMLTSVSICENLSSILVELLQF